MPTRKLAYSVIYSCDVKVNTRLMAPPPKQSHLWECTERSGGPEGGQMDWGVDGPEWARGRHRKYCALLTQSEFDEFIERCDLFADDVETMGSIGAPGFGFSLVPAISFNGSDHRCDTIQSAYVTPVPVDESAPTPLEIQPALPGFEDVALDVLETETQSIWREIREEIIDEYI